MSEQKYSKAVMLQWGETRFELGAVVTREHQIRDGSIAVRTEHGQSGVPDYPVSVIELRRSFEVKRLEGCDYRWAVFHWMGSAQNPAAHAVQALMIQDTEATEAHSLKVFSERVNQWKKTGSILYPDEWATIKGKMPQRTTKAAKAVPITREQFKEQTLTKARLKVLKQSFPETVKAMEGKGNSGLAFQYEGSKERPAGDAVDAALVTHWKAWQNLTAAELSDAVFKVTGERLKPKTLEKRRERLDLMTDRPTGPRPKTELP